MKKSNVLAMCLLTSCIVASSTISASAIDVHIYNTGAMPTQYGDIFVDSNNRTMVPLKAILDSIPNLGYWWDDIDRTVLVENVKTKKSVIFTIGSSEYILQDSDGSRTTHTMDTEAIIVNDRTYLPLRCMCESLGLQIVYDEAQNKVTIYPYGVSPDGDSSVNDSSIESWVSESGYSLDEEVFDGIPAGLGKRHNFTEWTKMNWGWDAKRVIVTLGGSNYVGGGNVTFSSDGFVKYGNWYAVAMTPSFGKVGDMLLVMQDDNTVYPVIIADLKDTSNMWGHNEGTDMVEFQITSANTKYIQAGIYAGPEFDHYITKVVNVGSVYDNPDYINDAQGVFNSSSINWGTFLPVHN